MPLCLSRARVGWRLPRASRAGAPSSDLLSVPVATSHRSPNPVFARRRSQSPWERPHLTLGSSYDTRLHARAARTSSLPGACTIGSLRLQHRPLRHGARLKVAPERDQELPRERDDPDPAQAAAPLAEALLIPAREGTRRLIPQPRPGDLDRHRADVPVPRLGDPLLVRQIPALVRRGREPRQRAHFAPVVEGAPAEELHHIEPRALEPDRAQGQEPSDLRHGRIGASAQELAACRPERTQLLAQARELGPLPLQPGAERRGERRAIPGPQPWELRREAAQRRERDALAGEEPLD